MAHPLTNPDSVAAEQHNDMIRDFHSAFMCAWYSEPHYRDRVVVKLLTFVKVNADDDALNRITQELRDITIRHKNPLRKEQ